MTVNDPYNNTLTKVSVTPALRTNGTATGTTVDRAGVGAAAGSMFQAATILVGTGTITDGTHTVEVQDSADGSAWAAVDNALLQGSEPAVVAADDDKVFELGYLGRQRYLRVVVVATGTTTGGIVSAFVILSDPRVKPVSHA